MTDRSPTPADRGTEFLLGKIEGQQRELVHTMNNQGQKIEAIGEKLSRLEGVPGEVTDIKDRLTAIEAAEHRREGERGLLAGFFKSPWIAWLILGAGAAWAFLTGRVET